MYSAYILCIFDALKSPLIKGEMCIEIMAASVSDQSRWRSGSRAPEHTAPFSKQNQFTPEKKRGYQARRCDLDVEVE